MSWTVLGEHLFIVCAASIASIVMGLFLGILAYLVPTLRKGILWVVDVLQTIPALALLGIIMVFLGAGKLTVILGITLYSLLPIVRNTWLGLNQVAPGIKEAALGCGMSAWQTLVKVELPLALPSICTGIRIAVVNAIGTTVFAAFVGGGGLGSILNRGIRTQNMQMILSGTGALMLIAIILDGIMGVLEKSLQVSHGVLTKKVLAPAVVLAVIFISVLPLGMSLGSTKGELVLYNGDYSETKLIHSMVKQLVEEKTNLKVVIKDQMSQVNNFKSLIGANHTCDLMCSYDGSLLTTFLHLDTKDVPQGMSIYDFTNEVAAKKYGIRHLKKMGFDNTYAIAVPQDIAKKYNLNKISDLAPVAGELVFGAEHEFFTQEGSMKYYPFTKFYGLQFKDHKAVDVSLKYAGIENDSFDVTEVYATDGLNRKANLKVLADDKKFFPDYNGALLVRDDTFTRFKDIAPNLKDVLNLLAGQISNEDMVNMTYQVDVEGKQVPDVARAFLVERHLLK
jgi:osmoprotectant transport system permease protein